MKFKRVDHKRLFDARYSRWSEKRTQGRMKDVWWPRQKALVHGNQLKSLWLGELGPEEVFQLPLQVRGAPMFLLVLFGPILSFFVLFVPLQSTINAHGRKCLKCEDNMQSVSCQERGTKRQDPKGHEGWAKQQILQPAFTKPPISMQKDQKELHSIAFYTWPKWQ